ncbi:MAG: lysophospholipid acyltransferase family protein [Deltaproteobacteria bacterium]|nr:lysophospholipid acyltransferase family protein [Deltaproteobacteria bacterium]
MFRLTPFQRKWIGARWPEWAAVFLKFLSRLVRRRIVGWEQTYQYRQVAFALWHGDDLALLPNFGHVRATIMISQSRDGEYLAKGVTAFGYHVVRGSSTRGGVGGLVSLIRAVRKGDNAIFAVDGPTGPRGVCKPGIVWLAQKTGVPIFPVGLAVNRKLVFKKTWHREYLPLPFAKQVIFFGSPLFFDQSDTSHMDVCCRRIEDALHSAKDRADELLAAWSGEKSSCP